jgi:recombination protein RecA
MFNTEALEAIATGLRRRWGSRALTKGAAFLQPPDPLPTGHPALDTLLEGGMPRPALVELTGPPTSGITSLALNLIANAQAEGGDATWLDLSHTFDPFRAEAVAVVLKRLLVVRPGSVVEAMGIVEDVVHGNGSSVVVVSSTLDFLKGFQGSSVLERGLRRLAVPLRHSTAIVLFLTPAPTAVLADHASVRLALRANKLLFREEEWIGFRSTVTLTKHKSILPGHTAISTFL